MSDLDVLKVYQYNKKIRLGAENDGGYVIADNLLYALGGEYDCYISAGVAYEDESFSRDFIQKYKMKKEQCFAFDGSLQNCHTEDITFHKKYISWNNDEHNSNLHFLIGQYNQIFLKMNIKGGEYNWLKCVDEEQLEKFKQIVIQFHGLSNDGWGCPYDEKYKCLRKLNKTHFLVHAHGNNCGPSFFKIPDVMEMTYVNKNCLPACPYPPPLNKTPLPIPNLDFPNDRNKADFNLNYPPFVILS